MPIERDPILEEFCATAPRLLRVEAAAERTRLMSAPLLTQLALHFDSGCLTLARLPGSDEIHCSLGQSAASADLDDFAEEEPWWRVLGNPLTAAWARRSSDPKGGEPAAAELTLQFRGDASNPRFISLTRRHNAMSVRCETLEQMQKRLASH